MKDTNYTQFGFDSLWLSLSLFLFQTRVHSVLKQQKSKPTPQTFELENSERFVSSSAFFNRRWLGEIRKRIRIVLTGVGSSDCSFGCSCEEGDCIYSILTNRGGACHFGVQSYSSYLIEPKYEDHILGPLLTLSRGTGGWIDSLPLSRTNWMLGFSLSTVWSWLQT